MHTGGPVVQRAAAACSGGGLVDPGTERTRAAVFLNRRATKIHGRVCGGEPGCAALASCALRQRRCRGSGNSDESAPCGGGARFAAAIAAFATACSACG